MNHTPPATTPQAITQPSPSVDAFLQAADQALEPRMHARVDLFINPNIQLPRYLVGRNADAQHLARLLPFQGVIDDSPGAPSQWCGLPVLPMHAVPKHAWVINCATSIAPVNVNRALTRANIAQRLHISDLLAHPAWPDQHLPWFVLQQREEFAQHRQAWAALYSRLEDAESKRVLTDMLCYRLSANPIYMKGRTVRLAQQYFEPFLNLKGEVFVDAGGFDGDTTELFMQHDPEHRRVYFVEPSPSNLKAAQQRLAGCDERITWLPVGLSSQAGQLNFNDGAGSASAVGQAGDIQIPVDTLDALVPGPVSFIKMDLEGWELHALEGCQRHIAQHQPKLAISVYHHAAHCREVCLRVLAMNPHYKVRLRHYTQGWSETVMFFTGS
ncbi:FkbM family methyltransferase [Limnobacter sp.]|uniref:FkbM family methyltransferase n=1 Tax=Limnobacter sp. TaxID=2003368 RepID=UPI003514DD8E